MLSLGHFDTVLEMLYGMRQFNRAARFVDACMEFGVLDMKPETSKYKEGNNRLPSVNLKPLVHKHNKAGSKCHTQDNTQVCE